MIRSIMISSKLFCVLVSGLFFNYVSLTIIVMTVQKKCTLGKERKFSHNKTSHGNTNVNYNYKLENL
ncbi:MAG: hypothetical protein CBC42_00815 [Betaproteobacteria bacterium TMED82]|nr:MAG: hypothetical protein CBC42_00815 [Betaproteobacteria bacterium TMED82]